MREVYNITIFVKHGVLKQLEGLVTICGLYLFYDHLFCNPNSSGSLLVNQVNARLLVLRSKIN